MAFSTNAALNSSTAISIPQADTAYLDIDFFIKRPDLLPKVFESWDNKGFTEMLMLTGREEVIYNETFSNYESGLLPRSVSIATATSATAGSVVVTLTTDSYTTVGSLAGATARSPLMENAIIKLPNRREAFVKIKSSLNGGATGTATTYTLVKSDLSDDAAFDIGAYFTTAAGSGQRFAITSAAFAEGSYEALEGVETPMVRYTGQLQICKTHSEITESAAGDRFELPLQNANGSKFWYSKQRVEQGFDHRKNEGLQMLTGKGGNFVDKSGKKVKSSMGLEGYVRAYGNVYDFPSTGFTVADLDAITTRIKLIMGGTEYQWIMGSELYRQVGTVIRSLPGLTGGGIRYDMFGKSDAAAKAIDYGFNSIIWNGITLHLQESPVFNHPELLGLPGYDYNAMGFLIPGQKTRITGSDNGVSTPLQGNVNADADSLRIRYKVGTNGDSRRYKTYDRGPEVTGFDATRHEILSHCGLQMVGLRRFILTQKGA